MGKIFILLGLALVVVLWWTKSRPRGHDQARHPTRPDSKVPQAPGHMPMLACAHCGVHLPKADALADPEGRWYCGEAHRSAGPK
jgi:uncharacterized protein